MSTKRLIWKIVSSMFALFIICYLYKTIFFADEYRTLHFMSTQCKILDKKLNQQQLINNKQQTQTMYQPLFLVAYTVNNKPYQEWTYHINNGYAAGESINENIFQHYQIGKSYQCWYDPTNPAVAVLSKIDWYFIPFFIFPALVGIYIAILVIRLLFRILAFVMLLISSLFLKK